MAYESMTYELILNRMMRRVSEKYPNLDTREGSVIFNALAPAAIELAIMYTELDNVLSESFVDTASRDYLLIKCKESGIDIEQFEPTYSAHKGMFDVEVPIGSRWNCDIYNYVVTEFLGTEIEEIEVVEGEEEELTTEPVEYYVYRLDCENEGTSPNNQVGDLTPITEYPSGLGFAQITECLIEGEEERTDDEIREKYYAYLANSAVDGNITQYKAWCDLFDGIGNYKIFPQWNGANTVKVSILSALNGVASEMLINDFQNHLDPNCEGMGNGVAPIGAFVTVSTATEVPINITADVKLKDGYDDITMIDTAVEEYFRSISYDKLTVAYMNVGSVILNAEGVESVSNLKLNGALNDIPLGEEEIPTVGTVAWTVVN
jgi:uncharacterized phage protein gp47/JayE